jgi:Protein of unknown function (DUF3892)
MAQELRIRCVNKTDRKNAHERIRAVGGTNPDGSRWNHTQERAIRNINDKVCAYYVEQPSGHRAKVLIGTSAAGNEYLKTEADAEQPNNLLSLP